MYHVGYITPYRVVLLFLIRRLCQYDYPDDLIPKFVVFITKSILNDNSVRETCSEPRLDQIFEEIRSFTDESVYVDQTINNIILELQRMNTHYRIHEFMLSLKSIIDDDSESEKHDIVVLDKCSVLGLFVRKCRIEFVTLPHDRLEDIHAAYNAYIDGQIGDAQFLLDQNNMEFDQSIKSMMIWVSAHNATEFLKSQAEKIETTGTSNVSPSRLHEYLVLLEEKMPNLESTRHVRYLNYTRSKEYILSRSYQHLFFDMIQNRENKGMEMQYSLLNLGILECKFGHKANALLALNEALSAARSNKDNYCLQEVQYWIEVCRDDNTYNGSSAYVDDYLSNMKTLTKARNMLRDGGPSRYVFESLYKSSINIIMKDVKNMHRVQYLIMSLAWQKYGNCVLSKMYLDMANQSSDKSIEDIEQTVISNVNTLRESGKPEKAFQTLIEFADTFANECDYLMDWRHLKARMLRQPNKKRHFDAMEHQANLLHFSLSPYTGEYFNAMHDRAIQFMVDKEFNKALMILEETHNFIQRTEQVSHLSSNLLLQGRVHLQINNVEAAIPVLTEAMKSSKRTCDTNNYYTAVIKLSEAFIRTGEPESLEKSQYMLESIFPKVLLTGSKLLESDLCLTYAEVLEIRSFKGSQDRILDYATRAEAGFEALKLDEQLLRALHFKTMVLEKMRLPFKAKQTLQKIRNLQLGS